LVPGKQLTSLLGPEGEPVGGSSVVEPRDAAGAGGEVGRGCERAVLAEQIGQGVVIHGRPLPRSGRASAQVTGAQGCTTDTSSSVPARRQGRSVRFSALAASSPAPRGSSGRWGGWACSRVEACGGC